MRTHNLNSTTARGGGARPERRDLHAARVRRVALIRPGTSGFSIVADPASRRARGGGPARLAAQA